MPTNEAVTQLLESFRSNPKDVATFRNLEAEYSRSKSWKLLAEVYRLRAECIKGDDPSKSAELFYKSGELEEKELGEREAGLSLYHMAFQLSPRKNYGDAILGIYANKESWDKCLEILRRQWEISSKNDEKISLLWKMGDLLRDHLANRSEAQKCFRQILSLDARNMEAMSALEKLYFEDKQWTEALEILQAEYKVTNDVDMKIRCLEKSASICFETKDMPRAIGYYNQILEITPDHWNSLKRLEELFQSLSNWVELVNNLQKQAKFIPAPEVRAKIFTRIANIYQNNLHNSAESAKFHEQSLACEENDSVLQNLEALYLLQKNWLKLADIYERQAKRCQDIALQTTIFTRLGRLMQDEIKDIPKAIYWLGQAYQHNTKDVALLHNLQELYFSANDWRKLEDSYRMEINIVSTEDEVIALYDKIASIYKTSLRDLRGQANIYEEIIKKYPGHRPTIENLQNLYTQIGNYPALLQVLHHEISLDAGTPTAIPKYLKAAELWKTKLNDEDKAIDCLEEVIKIAPNRKDILDKLYEYYARTQNSVQLIIVLQNLVQCEPAKAEEGYLEIAIIYRDTVKDPPKAIQNFHSVLQVNPNNLTAIRALADLYEIKGAWTEYLEMMQRRLNLCCHIDENIAIRFAMCKVYRLLQRIQDEESSLLEILKLQFNQRQAIDFLKNIYQSSQNWPKYVWLLEREAYVFPWKDAELFALYSLIAGLYKQELHNVSKAITYYEHALRIDPNHYPTLQELDGLYMACQDFSHVIEIKEKKLQLISDVNSVCQECTEIAEVWQKNLQNDVQAIQAYEKITAVLPNHIPTLGKLQELYTKQEKYIQLAQCYFVQGQNETSVDKKAELWLQCATIWKDKLANLLQAAFYYEEILKISPKNMQVLDILLKLYQELQKWQELCSTYERKIACVEESSNIVGICFELAKLYRTEIRDVSRAIKTYQHILEIDPFEVDAVNHLEDIYRECERYIELEQILKTKCSLVDNVEEKQKLLFQMGEICEQKLSDYVASIGHFEAILNYNPQHLEAIIALRKLYYKTQDFRQVVATIQDEIQLITDTSKQLSLWMEKAGICQNQLAELDVAIEAYEQVLVIENNNHKTYQELYNIYWEQKRYDMAVVVLEREIEFLSPDKQKELWTLSGKIRSEFLHDMENSKICWQQALSVDVTYKPSRELLESAYRQLKEWAELIAHYVQELDFATDTNRRAELYYSIGRIWEDNLNQPLAALEHYHEVVKLQPNNIITIQNLQSIYRQQDNFVELLLAYQKELMVEDLENERRIWVLLQCSEIQRYHLNDIDNAIANYLLVLDMKLDPNNLQAIRGLQELYEQKGLYKDVQNMLFKELELQKDPKRLIAVHLQLACLMEEKLQTLDVAIEHFSEAHLSLPENLHILRRLKRLLAVCKRWENYVEISEKEIALCSYPLERLPLHRNLLDIYDRELQNSHKAIEHGESAQAIAEEDLDTILKLQSLYQRTNDFKKLVASYQKEALLWQASPSRLVFLHTMSGKLAMESLQDLCLANECFEKVLKYDPCNKEAITALIDIRTKLKWWEDLIKICEYSAKTTKNPEEIISLHLKIADLWEREFQNSENGMHYAKALLSYQIVYTLDSKNFVAVNGMRKIFEKQQRWGDAIEFLNVEVALIEDKKRPALYSRMGEYWEEKLGMPHQALTCYLKVMGHGFHRATAERIMRIQEQVCDYLGLVEITERDIAVTQKPEEAIPKLLKIARILWKNLNDPDAAVEKYKLVLKSDKKQMDALLALEEIFTIQSKWKQLAQILQMKREALTDPKDLAKAYVQLGEVYDIQLHYGNQAIKHYESALEMMPHNASIIPILQILQRLYKEWGYYKKFISMCNKEISILTNRDHATINDHHGRVLFLYNEMGECWEKRLFEDEQAIKVYERFAEIDSESLLPVRALARLYKRYQSWDKMIGVYERLIAEALAKENNEEAVSLLLDLACVYQDETKNTPAAIRTFSKILELQPAHIEALLSLEVLYKGLGKSNDMAKLIQKKLSACYEETERVELYIHLGNLYDKELDDTDKAIDSFLLALQIKPDKLDVLHALDSLYLRKKKWQELADICKREIALTNDSNEKAELCYRLGMIQRDQFHAPMSAQQLFLDAINYQPSHRKALEALRGLAICEENWTLAVKYINMEIAHIQEPSEKVEALTDMGSLYQNKLKLIQKAREAFQQALDIDPESTIAIEAMADIYFSQIESNKAEALQQAETMFGRLVLLVDSTTSDKLSHVYYKWGIIAEKLNKKDDAIIRYSNSLGIKPDNLDSLMALGALYFERAQWGFDKAQWQEALDVYEKVFANPQLEGEQKLDVIRRLAKIYASLSQSDRAQSDRALEYYRKVLAQIPDDTASIQALAKLYIERKEDDEALTYLQTIVRRETSNFQDRRNAMLSIAEVQARLGHHKEALDARLRALNMGVEDHGIFCSIAEDYIAVKEWAKAKEFLNKHYQCLENKEVSSKIANRCLMAKIMEEGFQNLEQSVQMYKEVLATDPTYSDAIKGIARIYERHEQWNDLALAYQEFLSKIPESYFSNSLPIYISLGNLYFEKLNDGKLAIQYLTKALTIDPNHIGIHSALANIKSQLASFEKEAIQEHMWLLEREPLRVSSYHDLYKIYMSQNNKEHALRAARILSVLGNATEEEKKLLEAYPFKKVQPGIPVESLTGMLWNYPSGSNSVYRELLQINADLMNKVFVGEVEQRYGVKKKDHLTIATLTTPLAQIVWQAVEEIRAMLKIDVVDVYLIPKKSSKLILENTQPPSLIISIPLLENLGEEDIRFILAKTMFYICQNQVLAYKCSTEELQQYFRIFRDVILDNNTSRSPDDENMFRLISKELQSFKTLFSTSKIKKRELAERAELWERLDKEDITKYLRSLDFASNHCGLIFTDSVLETIQMIYRLYILAQKGKLVKVDRVASQDMLKNEGILDILSFHLSSEYTKLRQQLGQSL